MHLRFRGDVDATTKQKLYERLAALSDRIEGIVDFQHRANVSVEVPLVRGFIDMFWFDFRDAGVRDAYLADVEHQAIGADIVACLEGSAEGVFVCDIEP
ncbi:Dabb family protein [Antarctobacter heliothermus]|uniref:Dabb family protein n=1 Tax=Antarctobacter heliothermus TaxID=74033 RepID=UPI001FE2CA75|nr:Dabb family protein [Antarctobacter heliothermus]